MSKRIVPMTGIVVALTVALATPAAQAQFYLGGEGGRTGLEGTKDKIGGITINRSFDEGFNAGARFGYKWNE